MTTQPTSIIYFKSIVFWVILLTFGSSSLAYETDQYSTPDQPIADIGEDLSKFLYNSIQEGITELNYFKTHLVQDINNLESEIHSFGSQNLSLIGEATITETVLKEKIEKLVELRRIKNQIGTQAGEIEFLFQKYSGKITWNDQRDGVFGLNLSYVKYPNDRKNGKELNFNQSKFNTIYSYSGFHRLISPSFFVFASTINVYGTNMGVDKFGHFVNQGFEYFNLYRDFLNQGISESEALDKVIQWGVDSEDGLFGSLVDGVYSNGDLAANFSGFMFYQNLFSDLLIQGKRFPKIINTNADGSYSMSSDDQNKPDNLLIRFITDHLDESINASILERPQRSIVKQAIKNRCKRWISAHNNISKAEVIFKEQSTSRLFGYNYGKRSKNALLISDICY